MMNRELVTTHSAVIQPVTADTMLSNNGPFLPPATKFAQGYIFTGVCDSVHGVGGGGGVLSQRALQVVSQHALRGGDAIPACIAGVIPAYLAGGWGLSAPGGRGGGAWWRPPRTQLPTGMHSCFLKKRYV